MLRFSKFASRWISHYGMTIGIGDVTPNPKLIEENLIEIEKRFNRPIHILLAT
jgi:hypothetical protein